MAPISLTAATAEGEAHLLSVELTALVSSVSAELTHALAIPAALLVISRNGTPLRPEQTFASAGCEDGDLLLAEARATATSAPAAAPYESLALARFRAEPGLLAQIQTSHPALHAAVVAGNGPEVDRLFRLAQEQARQVQMAARNPAAGLDPMSVEAQELMAEEIRMQNVNANLEHALEFNPESFASVTMLFVDTKINGHATKAFVDSGAQTTIISKAHAERCNLFRLLDKRHAGIARGVGTATIHGKIHLAVMEIEGQHLEVSFAVMDDFSFDVLLGLDMLRKHAACIDLQANCLRIGGAIAPFLPEHKIPSRMKGSGGADDDEAQASPAPTVIPGVHPAAAATLPGAAVASRPAQAPAAAGIAAVARDTKTKVANLVQMGFGRAEATEALQACNGNIEQAAAMLTASKYGF
jgi:DNA damage-inducible protein 1